MSSVPFLRFPLSVQSEIVKRMRVRELVKFSFCSKRTHQAAKSAKVSLSVVRGHLEDGRLEMKMRNSGDEFTISISSRIRNIENNKLPKYTGFGGLRICDYTKIAYENVFLTVIVAPPEDQDFLETCDRVMGYLRGLFEDVSSSQWVLDPTNPDTQVILKKHFPKITSFSVHLLGSHDQRRLTKEDILFFLEQLEVTDSFQVLAEVEEGFQYSKGFQADHVYLMYPSWVHWDAVINSNSQLINLSNVRTLSSGDLNRFLKLWVSNEKMQSLTYLDIVLVRREGLEFPPDFLELILEGIRNDIDNVDPMQSNERKISRINGTMATVKLNRNSFRFQVD